MANVINEKIWDLRIIAFNLLLAIVNLPKKEAGIDASIIRSSIFAYMIDSIYLLLNKRSIMSSIKNQYKTEPTSVTETKGKINFFATR